MLLTLLIGGLLGLVWFILYRALTRKPKQWPLKYPDGSRQMDPGSETMTQTMHDMGIMLLANVLFLRTKKPLTEELIRAAMSLLYKEHPLLSCSIQCREGGDQWFVPCDMNLNLDTLQTTDWRQVMSDSLMEQFDHNGLQWRVYFLPKANFPASESSAEFPSHPHESACVFGFNHTIIDGTSYARLFQSFLGHMDSLMEGRTPEVSQQAMLPPFSHYLNTITGPESFMQKLFISALPFVLRIPGVQKKMMDFVGKKNKFIAKMGAEIFRNPGIEKRTYVYPLQFSKEQTRNILKKCKEHGATVQGAIQAASTMSLMSILHDDNFTQSDELMVGVTCNMRPFFPDTPVPPNYVGAYFAGLMMQGLQVNPCNDAKEFWDQAARMTKEIKKKVANKEYLLMTQFFKVMEALKETGINMDPTQFQVDESGRGESCLQYSNMGNCSFLDRDASSNIHLSARFGCSGEHSAVGGIFANNIITFGGKMFWTVTYYTPVTTEALAAKYANMAKKILVEAC